MVPGGAAAIAEELGIPVTLVVGRHTTEELEAQAARLGDELRAAGYTDIATGVDTEQDSVFGAVGSVAGSTAVRPRISAASLDVEYRITMVDGPVGSPEVIPTDTFGGRALYTSSQFSCTTGFSVKTAGFTQDGIVTAGHCSGANLYRAPNGTSYRARLVKAYEGVKGDFAYFDVLSSISAPKFYYANTAFRTLDRVAASADYDVGDYLCNYGRATDGIFCAKVRSTSISCNGIGSLVLMDKDITSPGDSGGPWYSGSTGYGVHYGQCNPWNLGSTSAFSKLYLMDDALGNFSYDVMLGT